MLVILAIGVYLFATRPSPPPAARPVSTAAIDGIGCNSTEQLALHIHAHLDIILDGQPQTIPANIGIPLDSAGNPRCFYWLHTHVDSNDPSGTGKISNGVIHVEAPVSHKDHQFTLGEFFAVWRKPLSSTDLAGLPVANDPPLTVIVDGQPYAGDPATIPLRDHELISLELGTPVPQPAFSAWPSSSSTPTPSPSP